MSHESEFHALVSEHTNLPTEVVRMIAAYASTNPRRIFGHPGEISGLFVVPAHPRPLLLVKSLHDYRLLDLQKDAGELCVFRIRRRQTRFHSASVQFDREHQLLFVDRVAYDISLPGEQKINENLGLKTQIRLNMLQKPLQSSTPSPNRITSEAKRSSIIPASVWTVQETKRVKIPLPQVDDDSRSSSGYVNEPQNPCHYLAGYTTDKAEVWHLPTELQRQRDRDHHQQHIRVEVFRPSNHDNDNNNNDNNHNDNNNAFDSDVQWPTLSASYPQAAAATEATAATEEHAAAEAEEETEAAEAEAKEAAEKKEEEEVEVEKNKEGGVEAEAGEGDAEEEKNKKDEIEVEAEEGEAKEEVEEEDAECEPRSVEEEAEELFETEKEKEREEKEKEEKEMEEKEEVVEETQKEKEEG